MICLRPGFDDRGFRQKEVNLALDVLRSLPPGRGFIIPFVVEPCKLPQWMGPIHAGDYLECPSGLDDLIAAINKHCKAELQPKRRRLREIIGEILEERGEGPRSYRRRMMRMLYWLGPVEYNDLIRECYKPPYTKELFLMKWQSLIGVGIMTTEGPGLNPVCRLSPQAKLILDEHYRESGQE